MLVVLEIERVLVDPCPDFNRYVGKLAVGVM
jgi:hypothetical protein